jgi:hypothetical protein
MAVLVLELDGVLFSCAGVQSESEAAWSGDGGGNLKGGHVFGHPESANADE